MKTNVRPFVREYKSLSLKATLPAIEKLAVSGANSQASRQRDDVRSRSDLQNARRLNDEAQREAEAIFRGDESSVPHSSEVPSTGRILPCLLQESSPAAPVEKPKTCSVRRGKALPSTTKHMTRRSNPSRERHRVADGKGLLSTQWRKSMSDEFAELSDLEVLSLIERAKTELGRRKESGKETLRAEIEAKLKDAGLELGDLFEGDDKGAGLAGKSKGHDGKSVVAAKYKNQTSAETWSGRGRSPKWVAVVMQERQWTIEDFKQSHEFLIA